MPMTRISELKNNFRCYVNGKHVSIDYFHHAYSLCRTANIKFAAKHINSIMTLYFDPYEL